MNDSSCIVELYIIINEKLETAWKWLWGLFEGNKKYCSRKPENTPKWLRVAEIWNHVRTKDVNHNTWKY